MCLYVCAMCVMSMCKDYVRGKFSASLVLITEFYMHSLNSWCDAEEWGACACVPNYQPREGCSNLTLILQMALRTTRGDKIPSKGSSKVKEGVIN